MPLPIRLHRRFDVDLMLHHIETDGITIEMAVAPIALALAAHPKLETYDLSSLRYLMWCATPVTQSVAEAVTVLSPSLSVVKALAFRSTRLLASDCRIRPILLV